MEKDIIPDLLLAANDAHNKGESELARLLHETVAELQCLRYNLEANRKINEILTSTK
jgi:hypothetical protein